MTLGAEIEDFYYDNLAKAQVSTRFIFRSRSILRLLVAPMVSPPCLCANRSPGRLPSVVAKSG
jgi:hypothetical protein